MRIEPHNTVAGTSMQQVADLLRWMKSDLYLFSLANIARHMQLELNQAEALITELQGRQMIAVYPDTGQQTHAVYHVTSLGKRVGVGLS